MHADERRPRFNGEPAVERDYTVSRERATSQPPRRIDTFAIPAHSQLSRHRLDNSLGDNVDISPTIRTSPGPNIWPTSSRSSSFTGSNNLGASARAVPVRSASFSASHNSVLSSYRDGGSFPSTFEDDEDEYGPRDEFEPYDTPHALHNPLPRHFGPDGMTRSRSQSLAAIGRRPSMSSTLPAPGSSGLPQSWGDPQKYALSAHPRYGSGIATANRSNTLPPAPSPSAVQHAHRHIQDDLSNMSPFVRDLHQISLEDGANFRDYWGNVSHRDDGGGSGTTSRRHSVSIVQPRSRATIGFTPSGDQPYPINRDHGAVRGYTSGNLMISDDELAGDFNTLSLNLDDGQHHTNRVVTHSQPSSLPNYAQQRPLNHASEQHQGYIPLNLPVPHSVDLASSFNHQSRGPYGDSTESPPPINPLNRYDLDSGNIDSTGRPRLAYRPSDQQRPTSYIRTDLPPASYGATPSPSGHGPTHGGANNLGLPSSGVSPNVQYQQPNRRSLYNSSPLQSPASPTGQGYGRSPQAVQAQAQNGYFPQRQPTEPAASELGKGLPIHTLPASHPLYVVEFKAGRTDLFYGVDHAIDIRRGDLVIVEADRGKDLGKVINDSITAADVDAYQRQGTDPSYPEGVDGQFTGLNSSVGGSKRDLQPKRIYGKAQPHDTQLLVAKMQDEAKALQLCQSKVRQKKLPMEVVDAEYQWDRRKLTFYFVADRRIDFRELVRELFRLYKTRIWMACLQGPGGSEQQQ